ncbi:MAG: hypothetical protein ACLSU0_00285 [Oscillospiraceae bacterium]
MKIFTQQSFNREIFGEVTPAEYLEVMFANVEDGKLAIGRAEDEWGSDLSEDENAATRIYHYTIDMEKVSVKAMVEEVNSLIADLKEIAEKGGFNNTAENTEAVLGGRLYKIWEKYVRKSVSESEKGMIAEYAARIGGKVRGASVVNRAQRLVKMFELGAPEIIVLDEERNFAEALALNICANEVE